MTEGNQGENGVVSDAMGAAMMRIDAVRQAYGEDLTPVHLYAAIYGTSPGQMVQDSATLAPDLLAAQSAGEIIVDSIDGVVGRIKFALDLARAGVITTEEMSAVGDLGTAAYGAALDALYNQAVWNMFGDLGFPGDILG